MEEAHPDASESLLQAVPHHHTKSASASPSPPQECNQWWEACVSSKPSSTAQWVVPLIVGLVFACAAFALAVRDWKTVENVGPQEDASDRKVEGKLRIHWFDNCKMIAIIGVAMDHAFEFVPGALLKGTPAVFLDPRMPVFKPVAKSVFFPTMPLFFFLAGVVCNPEPSRRAFLANVVGLLLPPVSCWGSNPRPSYSGTSTHPVRAILTDLRCI
jgi:hypothetical protein